MKKTLELDDMKSKVLAGVNV